MKRSSAITNKRSGIKLKPHPAAQKPDEFERISQALAFNGFGNIEMSGAVQQISQARAYYMDYLNFDPHYGVPGTNESFYQLWRRQYRENPYAHALPNVVTNLVMGSGFNLKTTDQAENKRWEDWKRGVNFEPIARQGLRTALVFGNGYINLPPANKYGVDSKYKIAMQPLQPDHIWNIPDSTGRVIGFWYSIFNSRPTFDVSKQGKITVKSKESGEIMAPEDVFYIRFDQLGADVYGRPLGSALENDLDQIELLEAIQYVMGFREAHGMIIFEVDTTQLQEIADSTSKVSKADGRVSNFASQIKNQERFDTKTRNMRIASRIVIPTKMIPGPDGKMFQIGGVTPKPILQNMDMKGINDAITQRRQKIAMGYQVPANFSGITDNPLRGQATGELTTFSQFLKSVWTMIASELEIKVFPILKIKSHLTYDEIVSGKDALAAQNASLIAQIPVLTDFEKRTIIGDILDVDIDASAPVPVVALPPKGIPPPGGGKPNVPKTEQPNSNGIPNRPVDPKPNMEGN